MTPLKRFIAAVNFNIKSGNHFFTCEYTKFTVCLVKALIKYNYVIGYRRTCKDSLKLIVFFKLNFEQTKPLMLSCKQISKQPKSIRIKSAQNLQGSSCWLLATTRGILTAQEA